MKRDNSNALGSNMILVFLLLITVGHCFPRQPYHGPLVKRSTRNRCCGSLGCFDTSYPFGNSKERPLSLLPKCPDQIGTKFTVYTKKTLHVGFDIKVHDRNSITQSEFDASKSSKVVIHGFIEDTNVAQWMHEMKEAFLIKGDFNVILVDWGGGSGLPYTQATANTRVVGAQLAELIKYLETETGVNPESFHVVGHSLGAHIAGYAGERLQYLGRITGMDAADPYFSGTDRVVRLDPSDALFVDVIHTDGDHLISSLAFDGGLGMSEPCGHVDFYPNGGEDQPGCDRGLISSIAIDGIYGGGKKFVACDHLRVYELFTESINSRCPFKSYPCSSYDDFKIGNCLSCGTEGCAYMGYNADKVKPRSSKSYYLDTGGNKPFCRYHYGASITLSTHQDAREERGRLYIMIFGERDQTDEIPLTSGDEYYSPGETYNFFLNLDKDLGSLTSVDFRWDHNSKILNPGHWAIFRTPKLRISRIKLDSGILNERRTFCGPEEIEQKVRESFSIC